MKEHPLTLCGSHCSFVSLHLQKMLLNQKSVNERLSDKAWSQWLPLLQLRLTGILCALLLPWSCREPALREGCPRLQLLTGCDCALDTTLSKQWCRTFPSCKGSHRDAASHAAGKAWLGRINYSQGKAFSFSSLVSKSEQRAHSPTLHFPLPLAW